MHVCQFLESRNIGFEKMRGIGFDGASTMSGKKSGVQLRMRLHAPSAIYVHCQCHKLQLAAIDAAKEHTEVKRVMGTLLTIWKAFHYSPQKAEKLAEVQAVLNSPGIKMQKPSDTRWLSLPEAPLRIYMIKQAMLRHMALLPKYKTVSCIYMLSDVLHTVAKLQGSMQGKEIDLAGVPAMVDCTIKRLMEMKENVDTTTWFKDHSLVFSDADQLGNRNIVVTNEAPFFKRCIGHTCRVSLTTSMQG